MVTLTLQISKLTKAVVLKSFQHGRFWQFAGADPERGAPLKLEKIWFFCVKSWFFTRNTPTIFAPPSAIGKNKIFWCKIVVFHTKYPNNFRAPLRSGQFFKCAPPNLKSWIRPCIVLAHWNNSLQIYIYVSPLKHTILMAIRWKQAFKANKQVIWIQNYPFTSWYIGNCWLSGLRSSFS